MARKPGKPWKWKQRNRWCATIRGERVVLDADPEDEQAAVTEWHRRMAAPAAVEEQVGFDITAKYLLKLHQEHVRETRSPRTAAWYEEQAKSFGAAFGHIQADQIQPEHIARWVARHQWAPSTRRGAIGAIKAAFRWACKRKLIPADTLAEVERPRATRREKILSAEQVEAIKKFSKEDPFGILFFAVSQTGCRPGEACAVQAKHFDPIARTWTLPFKTSSVTGKLRVVYLPPLVVELCKKLAVEHPEGPLFRNARGRPWKRHGYGHRLRRMRKGLGLGPEAVMSCLRHLFVTDALISGQSVATVAVLAGHSNTRMVDEVYSMLHQRTDHLRQAVAKIRPVTSHANTSGAAASGEAST